jgi:hypothetical protein
MSVAFRPLETLQRHAPLGLRFWDVAGMTSLVEGLQVDVFPVRRAHVRTRALMNRSGIYSARALPGLASFELSDAPPPAPWAIPLHEFRVEVVDPQGRFLPIAFDAALPHRGLWTSALPLPATLFGESGTSPPGVSDRIPLFSAPARAVRGPVATIYAQLAEAGTGAACAWSLLEAVIGTAHGFGLADREGRVVVMMPYPAPPRPPITSPPLPREDFRWDVELHAFWRAPVSPAVAQEPPLIPDLDDIFAQLGVPRTVLGASGSPPLALGPQRLEYQVPLTVRTPDSPLSRLLVSTA